MKRNFAFFTVLSSLFFLPQFCLVGQITDGLLRVEDFSACLNECIETQEANWPNAPDYQTIDIKGTLVVAKDNSADPQVAFHCCGNPITDVAGNIALVGRGTCLFGQKAQKLEDAGAIAVIICNTEDATTGLGLENTPSAPGREVSIPVLSISSSDCERLLIELENNTVTATIRPDQCTSPTSAADDKDNDGMPDTWEIANGLDECDPKDALCDSDRDQVINLFEYQLGSDPNDASTPTIILVRPEDFVSNDGSQILDQIDNSNEAIVLRYSEGSYAEPFLINNLAQEDRPTRLMVQGGWDADFSSYDPFLHRTFFERDQVFGSSQVSLSTSESVSQRYTHVFDGIEFSNSGVSISYRGNENFMSFYNCSFYDIRVGDMSIRNGTYSNASNQQNSELWIINTS